MGLFVFPKKAAGGGGGGGGAAATSVQLVAAAIDNTGISQAQIGYVQAGGTYPWASVTNPSSVAWLTFTDGAAFITQSGIYAFTLSSNVTTNNTTGVANIVGRIVTRAESSAQTRQGALVGAVANGSGDSWSADGTIIVALDTSTTTHQVFVQYLTAGIEQGGTDIENVDFVAFSHLTIAKLS